MGDNRDIFDTDGDVKVEKEHSVREPRLYRVILHNDHYTTMDFVVMVLMKVFHMPEQKATQVMIDVHRKGSGMCGVFTLDIAVSKVNQVHQMARSHEYPLRCSYEEA